MKRLQTNAPLRPPASSGPIPDERAAGHSEVTSATDRRLRLACHSLGSRCGSIAWRGPAHRQAAHIDGKSPDRRRRSIARTPPSVDWRPKPLPNMKFRSRAAARLRVPIPGDGLRSSTPVAPAQGSNLSRERAAAARPGDSRSRSWTRAPTDRAGRNSPPRQPESARWILGRTGSGNGFESPLDANGDPDQDSGSSVA